MMVRVEQRKTRIADREGALTYHVRFKCSEFVRRRMTYLCNTLHVDQDQLLACAINLLASSVHPTHPVDVRSAPQDQGPARIRDSVRREVRKIAKKGV